LQTTKALHLDYQQAIPAAYHIDEKACLFLTRRECKQCERVCLARAIDFTQQVEDLTIRVGAILLCPGFEEIQDEILNDFGYGRIPNVVTSTEFERLLSPSGPFQGHLLCPSSGKKPQKIAWLQCVGSRELRHAGHGYCSSVCCMYAIKQTLIAKEHGGRDLDTAIFFMDIRTFGKDFEKYYQQAMNAGVRCIRSRVHSLYQDPGRDPIHVTYLDSQTRMIHEAFDLVVLSTGLKPPSGARDLAQRLSIDLDAFDFALTSTFSPVSTSVPGIYVAGCFQEPKDIPGSVTDASAGVCAAVRHLVPARNTEIREKTFPAVRDVSAEQPRTGVVLCNCGVNIGSVVHIPEVAAYAKKLPHVVVVREAMFACSQDALNTLKATVQEHKLNRIVLAACSPRTHESLFQETLSEAGLNKYLFEMANIRDQDSWVHRDKPAQATQKAKDQVRMAVAKANRLWPLEEREVDITPAALVIGGGVAGMTAALALAEQGLFVHLVEKTAHLGGQARYICWNRKGEEIQPVLQDIVSRVEQNDFISLYRQSEIRDVQGYIGNFRSQVLGPDQLMWINHGVTILATGAQASAPKEYLLGNHPRVFKGHELDERIIRKDPLVTRARCAVFIQCVGSREPGRPYCSRICCTQTMITALKLKEVVPDIQVVVLYRDIRTYGPREDLYTRARAQGILFVRYTLDQKPQVVSVTSGGLSVRINDSILNRNLCIEPDFIHLATAIVPTSNEHLASLYKVPLTLDNFYLESHTKLRPVESSVDGVFLCGTAHYPKSLEESITQAMAAASKAAGVLIKKNLKTSGQIACIDPKSCVGCQGCLEVCPFGAIDYIQEQGLCQINAVLCKGCGACAATCPSGSITLHGFTSEQINAQIEEVMGE
jgi:heterodisulfide reductase subunit A